MQKIFYKLFISFYSFGAFILSFFNEKAKRWVEGRKNIFEKISASLQQNSSPLIWFHCASLGEFEQGRPVMEKLKNLYPSYKILLTFFSPSGYEVRKNYEHADFVFYLPVDTKKNAEQFLDITKPSLIIFIKYEFWNFYLNEARQRNIHLLLASAIFRKDQPFFKWYGSFYRNILHNFTHVFVQDSDSLSLLKSINFNNASISGDTRFDRVTAIANHFKRIHIIERFCGSYKVIVAGSTWIEDDEELDHFVNKNKHLRFIIAPHDISKDRLTESLHLYKNSVLFSDYVIAPEKYSSSNTLIINNIGMLNKLYAYATVCYIGGAFGEDGVHNVLEAAVYDKPVVFGPVYDKYLEAVELIEAGGAFSITNALELENQLNVLLNDTSLYNNSAKAAGDYVKNKTGATEKIITYIQEKRLLTN